MIEVIDNYLPEDVHKEIQRVLTSPDFAWYIQPGIATPEDTYKMGYNMTHLFYDKDRVLSEDFFEYLLEHLFKDIKYNALIRIKANHFPGLETLQEHGFHTDYRIPHKGFVYSVNTCNGYTLFEDGQKVESVANRIMFFDPNIRHASTNCSDQKYRININANYL